MKPIDEINDHAMRLLVREMGAADAARFLSQLTVGEGNYTEERRERLRDVSLDDAILEIKAARDKTT